MNRFEPFFFTGDVFFSNQDPLLVSSAAPSEAGDEHEAPKYHFCSNTKTEITTEDVEQGARLDRSAS